MQSQLITYFRSSRSGGSTLAVAGVFRAGKTQSLTFLLAWLALTTHLKIAIALTLPRAFMALQETLKVALAALCLVLLVLFV